MLRSNHPVKRGKEMGNQSTQIQRGNASSPGKSNEKSVSSEKPAKPRSTSQLHLSGKATADIPLTSENILQLQRTIGNHSVNRLIQAKLQIGQPDDEYEREADQVAEQVLRKPEQEMTNLSQTAAGQVQPFTSKREDELQRQAMPEEEKRKRPEEEGMMQMKSAGPVNPVQLQAMSEEEKRKRPEEEGMMQMKQAGVSGSVQRQTMNPEEEERKKRIEEEGSVQAKEESGETPSMSSSVESQVNSMRGRGEQLPENTRAYFETRLGRDFGEVRVHKGAQAAESAKAINAKAFTTGKDIVLGAGEYAPETTEGKKLLAHELTHVVQQGSLSNRVQRYEAGEHAQFGETQTELQTAFAPISYVVQKGDRLSALAAKFGLTRAELKDANKDKVKKWPAADGSGRIVEGFNAGETISIPQKLNDFAKSAVKDKSATFTINGVVLDYGVGIAMGDLFESPEQMAKASPDEIRELAALIKREQTGGKPVTTEEWQKATRGRYLKLAEKNVAHFAPPSATLVAPSAAGAAGANHQSEWEKHHLAALDASRSGDKDKALMTNAFGDHFLTDAFAAGHLINKLDVMEQFKSQLKLDAKGEEFTKESQKFFNDVAKDAFTGSVKTEFSKYETVEFKGVVFRPNIDSESRFSALLQGIHKEEPDLLANAVAKGVHDKLNTMPGGLTVENAMGDSWQLSGDGTLNAKTKEIARKAVAQSQLNVISVYNLVGPLNTLSLFKKVWDYTPRPSGAGIKQVVDSVKQGTDINSADLKKAVVNLIRDNYLLIIDELVKRKKLKKA